MVLDVFDQFDEITTLKQEIKALTICKLHSLGKLLRICSNIRMNVLHFLMSIY